MNKKIFTIIIAIIAICAIGITLYFFSNKDLENEDKTSTSREITENESSGEDEDTTSSNAKIGDGKVLVVYYSATNNTKSAAEKLAKNLDGDLFEIEPVDEYTSDDLNWTNENSRVSKEHADETLRDVKLKTTIIATWEDYDTVLIGYPIWWGIAAWPVDTFVKANDFNGKTVIPFCTSASSGLGESGKLLEKEANGGNWQAGIRFSSSPSDADIKNFTDSLR